jgi:broad specificity phosphatase PhoE
MSTALLLCRHGETDWNREGRILGQRDLPLNEVGRAQAVSMGERLASLPLSAVFASPLRRAQATAALAFPGHTIRLDARLLEVDCGAATGLTRAEFRTLDEGRWWDAVTADPERAALPSGESFGAVRDRMVAALTEFAAAYPEDILAVVSHGTALEVATAALLGRPLAEAASFSYANGTYRLLSRQDGGWVVRP